MLARRTLIQGLCGLPLATATLAATLADPGLARAAADKTRLVQITTRGGQSVAGALALPDTTPAPAVILVHEWWGLNDQIKAMAGEIAAQGYVALAVDLFQGRVAQDPEQARRLTEQLDPAQATDTLTSWIAWARNHDKTNRKLAVVGWCFGGGWAINAAVAAPVDATVVYYGRVNLPPERLAQLHGPVLGHFATRDAFITKPIVESFETAMKAVGKPYTVYWYDADHAFANPTGKNYDQPDAQLAWGRTLAFLKDTLG